MHPLRAEQVKVIIKKTHKRVFFYGASLGIRTPDLCIRSALLYPAELMTHILSQRLLYIENILLVKEKMNKFEIVFP